MPFIAFVIAALVLVIDQVIKFFIDANLKPIGEKTVIDGIFSLRYVENRGVAFGMFQDMRWVFVALTSVLLIALIVLVVFLIVLVSNLTDTIKKTNAIIDGGTNAAVSAKAKVDNVSESVKGGVSKVTGVASGVASVGAQVAGKVIDKVVK